METEELDYLDYKILEIITNNARISFLEVARLCNVSGGAIHQRVHKLQESGVITGSTFSIQPKKIGFQTCAFVSLYFDNSVNIDEAVQGITAIEEITECHQTTGSYDLLVKIYAKNNKHLHEIIQKKLRPLGVNRSESIISYQETFCRQITVKQ